MKIGIVSDLHRHVPESLHEALRGCERIICAGDVERESVLWELQTIAPITAVSGNNDWSLDLPFSVTTTIGGVTFFIVHRPEDIGVPADNVDVIVHGHTHIPRDQTIGNVRYLNPGSTSRPRGGSAPSCMTALIANGKLLEVELVELPEESHGWW